MELERFGGKGDDSTDNLDAFNAAITVLGGKGGIINLRPGIYRTSGVFTVGNRVNIVGNGFDTSVIKTTSSTADIVCLNGEDGGVRNLSFMTTVSKSAGAAVKVSTGHRNIIRDIRVHDNMYDGVSLYSGTENRLFNFRIGACSHAGISVDGTAGTPISCYFNTGTIYGSYDGILLKSISGGYFTDIDVMASTHEGIYINPDIGKSVAHVWFTTVLGDSAAFSGYHITTNGGKVHNIELTGCWGATCGQAGIKINSNDVNGVTVNGGIYTNNQDYGIIIYAGKNIRIMGATCSFNSQAGSGLYHGIAVAGGISNFQIIGCNSGKGGQFETNNQGYGILINSGSSDYYIVSNNLCQDNVTGTISDAGTGIHKSVMGNV